VIQDARENIILSHNRSKAVTYWIQQQKYRMEQQQRRRLNVADTPIKKLPAVDAPFAMVVKSNIPQVLFGLRS
jgi:hypothetical protein